MKTSDTIGSYGHPEIRPYVKITKCLYKSQHPTLSISMTQIS